MQLFNLVLVFGVVAYASACSQTPGTTTTTVTTTVTTVTADDEGEAGLLSANDRRIIRKTWDQAKKDGDVPPQILFRFIKAHPEYQKMFKSFADVPQAELLSNGNFLAQAYTILAGLNVVIQSLSSQELVANQINALGGAHQPRGATPIMFEQFGEVAEEVLAEELGSAFNAEARQAWKNGMRALVTGITRNLKKAEDLADPQTKLTPHQIRDVQTSWENIRADRNSMVSAIFIKLFKETPRTQKHFVKFASVAIDALPENAEYNKQVALVADRLDTIISAMNDKLQLLGNINYMRYTHQPPRAIARERFEDFARLLLDVLSSKGVSADDMDSWRGVLTIFVDGVSPRQ
ncbi:2-domain hemoglobin [Daphnia sinensis]|uniref:2-domain hemoglobin n=1 Tax=Daphnia sinensis TaxID=1820382 RepID=A0AAD5LIF7_9CRUS|nr:2-domain hemoglobin [Daphnia sinensis]